MKVAVYHKNDDIRIEDQPEPEISGGEILVKMKASGICGTDVMEWYRVKKAPRILGHEMSGEISAVGEDVRDFNPGERVFVSHHVPCYNCHLCSQGKYTACETLHRGNYFPGGFAEYIRVPALNVRYGTFRLPESISYEDATMIEPLGCVVAGQSRTELKKGQSVVILGSGISGLLHIQLAKQRGARVIATDINEYRMNKARMYGADYVLHADEYSIEKLRELNQGRLADLVIVCAGARKAINDAVTSVDSKGILLIFAVSRDDISVPAIDFWRNEISVLFSYGADPDHLRKAVELIRSGRVDVSSMVSHRVPLSDIQRGFQLVAEARESLKVVIVPGTFT